MAKENDDAAAGSATAPVEEEFVKIPLADLAQMQKQMAELERKDEERVAQMAGLESMIADGKSAEVSGDGKLREKKSYEPKFRTVRIRKFPIKGDVTNMGYVVGWTSRGAYQEVDRSGISPQVIDMIDVIFLGHERNEKGTLQAEKIKLLDLLNKGEQVYCKIVSVKRDDKKVPTGEEIDVTMWDPQHGLVATGDKIDGFVGVSDFKYTIEVPGVGQAEVDGLYVN